LFVGILVCGYYVFLVGIFATTFSRHAKAQASLALVIWLIENVRFFATDVFSPQHTSKLVCVRLIENVVSSRAGEGLPWYTVGSADKARSV